MIPNFEFLAIRCRSNKLEILDQRKLPDEEIWLHSASEKDMFVYIKELSVRGAPMIGVSAAMSIAVKSLQEGVTAGDIIATAEYLRSSRPTAVNLMYCCDAVIRRMQAYQQNKEDKSLSEIVCDLAWKMLQDEVEMCDRMSKYGAALIQNNESILTHCNTGSLATPGSGTALGVIREAHRQGKNIHVYVDETRPLLQGGRLTAYELRREGIPHTIICDNMAATLMRQGKIHRVLVGADRIATNGDFANKIGTYSVAVIAKYHGVPFHPVAPVSTVDFQCPSGEEIPIEERKKEEVLGASGSFGSVRWAPIDSPTFNPAFDVTPSELVTSLILDTGVYPTDQLKAGCLKNLPKK